MEKPILYFDMDNVLVDFQSGLDQIDAATRANYEKDEKGKPHYDDIPGIFALMKPVDGAQEAVKTLMEKYECYILSTAPWNNPTAWSDKVEWINRYFGDIKRPDGKGIFHKRLILTHHKDLCLQPNAWLIDDRDRHGATAFCDHWIQFGQGNFKDWQSVVDYLMAKN